MTIQKLAVLCLPAVLLTTQQADAQVHCPYNRPIVVRPTPHFSLHHLHRTARPHLINPYAPATPVQTVEVPPSPAALEFGAFSHVDELAAQLEVLLQELCLDLAYNYTHNVDFHATYTEAYELYRIAASIHASEHNYDREGVRRQLGGADALFHHIQDDVRGWTRIHRRQVGTLGIAAKMDLTEDTLHHLMTDVGVAVSPELEVPPTPQDLTLPARPTALRTH